VFFGCINQSEIITPSNEMSVVVYGEVNQSKCCKQVDDTLIYLDANYLGKLVRVEGLSGRYPCPDPSVQCYGGNIFSKLISVQLVDYDENTLEYLSLSLDKNSKNFVNYWDHPGPSVCNDNLLIVGDINYPNVDLNKLFYLNTPEGFILRVYSYPSACNCGKVGFYSLDLLVDSNGHSKLLRQKLLKEEFVESCIN
jgi:hypothetical protein